jgi:hypothetical protein
MPVGRAEESTDVSPLGRVELVPIEEIRASDRNPRKIPERAVQVVAESLRTFGWQQPIVIDAAGEIIAGHTRRLAALSLGLTKVPAVRAEGLTPEQVRAYRIADNRSGDFSSWDFPELARELEALGTEFADVLAVSDWSSVMASFEEAAAAAKEADEQMEAESTHGFDMVVTFPSRELGLAAAEAIFDLGAVDVRHKLR